MKLEFRGWQREVTVHEHDLRPVTEHPGGGYTANEQGETVEWADPLTVLAKISDTALSGAFLVTISFEPEELQNWLLTFAKAEPEEAIRYMAEAQAEAVIALSRMTQQRLTATIEEHIKEIREDLDLE